MKGTVAADWHIPGKSLRKLAEEAGIDLDHYSPVGIEIDFGESDEGKVPTGWVSIYATKNDVVGKTYEEAMEYYDAHDQSMPVSEFLISKDSDYIFKLLKRLRIRMYSGYKGVDNWDVVQQFDNTEE